MLIVLRRTMAIATCVLLAGGHASLARTGTAPSAKQLHDAQAGRDVDPDGGLALLRSADAALRKSTGLAFTVHREGVGASATREPNTIAHVVLERRLDATRAGLSDAEDRPQWRVAAFGTNAPGPPGQTHDIFAMAMDDEHVRFARFENPELVTADHASGQAALAESGALAALDWLSQWDTLVGHPLVDAVPRELPLVDGRVGIHGIDTHAIYVDLSEFPETYAFGAWWYLGVEDHLPRRLELVYYDVRGEDKLSRGDGITRITITDVKLLHSQEEISQAVTQAANAIEAPDQHQQALIALTGMIDRTAPFTLSAPETFRAIDYQPPADQRRAQRAPAVAINVPAPDFTLLDPQGNAHTLSDYRGKVVILDFWATWCGPCLMVMPDLNAIHQKYVEQGVVVAGVNAWENGDPAALMKARNWDYLLLLEGDRVAADYQVTGIPTLVVVDQAGTIVARHVGADPQLKRKLEEELSTLLRQ